VRSDWTPPISDDAVRKATGRDWAAWTDELNRWATELDHKTLARTLHQDHALSPWWSQMVSGTWEMLTGRRDPHQRACDTGGKYQASASKTVRATTKAVEGAFQMPQFAQWAPAGLFNRTSGTPGKSINGRWSEGGRLAIWLTEKPGDKTQIGLSHEGLDDAEACEHWKAQWREALSRLKQELET